MSGGRLVCGRLFNCAVVCSCRCMATRHAGPNQREGHRNSSRESGARPNASMASASRLRAPAAASCVLLLSASGWVRGSEHFQTVRLVRSAWPGHLVSAAAANRALTSMSDCPRECPHAALDSRVTASVKLARQRTVSRRRWCQTRSHHEDVGGGRLITSCYVRAGWFYFCCLRTVSPAVGALTALVVWF